MRNPRVREKKYTVKGSELLSDGIGNSSYLSAESWLCTTFTLKGVISGNRHARGCHNGESMPFSSSISSATSSRTCLTRKF